MVFIHLIFIILYKRTYKEEESKCNKCLNKTWFVFSFTIYIRLLMETSQYILLTSFYELAESKTNEVSSVFSYICAVLIFSICLIFLTVSILLWIRYRYNFDKNQHKYFKELFEGLRNRHRARLYSSMLMLRRVVFVIFLITFKDIDAIT